MAYNDRGFAMARRTRVRLPEQKPIKKRKIKTITNIQVSSVKQRTEAQKRTKVAAKLRQPC